MISGTLLLLLFSNQFILEEVMRKWEIKATHYHELENHDVGIVLGGILFYDSKYDRIQFYRSNDRLLQALELYKRGKIKKILFVGGSGSITHPDIKEAPLVKRFLTELEIPVEDLLIETESKNTHENALLSKPILEQNFPDGKYLLITSGSHMRRSIACFKNEGITVTPYSTDRIAGPRKYELDHLLVPESGTLANWNLLLHEWMGYLSYKIAGYL